jgi:uncharacterized protein (TIGR02391 family)
MHDSFHDFERIVRRAGAFTDPQRGGGLPPHPFEQRNIHPSLPPDVRRLFDNGHYAQSTFEAFKFLDKEIHRHSGLGETGFRLMMQALAESSPLVKLTPLSNASERDEQKGFQFVFAGSALAIRNPRGHEYSVKDDPDTCLDHLSLASMLLRRVAEAGYK